MSQFYRVPSPHLHRGLKADGNLAIFLTFHNNRCLGHNAGRPRCPQKPGATICQHEKMKRCNQMLCVLPLTQTDSGLAEQADHIDAVREIELLRPPEKNERTLSLA